MKGAPTKWHAQGMKHFREIMRAPGKFRTVSYKGGIKFQEKRLPDGRGLRLNMDNTFKGFID
jgi:filamentous hemagglutinin